jgi:PAS domain S-box-containing protein
MAINQAGFAGESLPASDVSPYVLDIPCAMLGIWSPPRIAEKPAATPASTLKGAMRAMLGAEGASPSDHQLKAVLARVSDAMLEGVVVCDARGDITYANDNLCQMLGYTSDELAGKPAVQFFGEIAARGERYETELHSKGGRAIVVEVCSELIVGSKGKHLGAFAVLMDITSRANALRQSEAEVRLLSAQFMAAQELERQRIARELHDSIGQALGGVKFGLETCEALLAKGAVDAAARTMQQFAARIQSVVEEVRRISMNLRPSTLDDLGILPTLGWFTREFKTIYEHLDLEVQLDVGEDEIAVPVKTAIYRIVQEAFNNVVTHSKARAVGLVLRRHGSQIELRIRDNGAGFDPAAFSIADDSGRGLGLASMRERAEVTGGRFSLQSESARGTTVRVMWPSWHPRPSAE